MPHGLVYIILFSLAFLPSTAQAAPYFPADPDTFSKQWHLQKIEAYEAWDRTLGSAQVVVAVLDSGVDLDHPDLKDNIWVNPGERLDGADNDGNIFVDDLQGWDFVEGDNDPRPNTEERGATLEGVTHGTALSGIIAAVGNNGLGITGVAPQVKIMPVRVIHSNGQGEVGAVLEGIKYALSKGADIINLSFVGQKFDTELFLLLRQALQKGVLTVAAVGNEDTLGRDLDKDARYPVCYSGEVDEDVVLGVTALDKDDLKPRFSNYGSRCADLAAPGVDIYTTTLYRPKLGLTEPYGYFSGSSMAAPQVAGVAALIKSINPAYQASEIRDILFSSADTIAERDPEVKDKLGKGRLNAKRALELAASGRGFGTTGAGIPHLLTAVYSKGAPEVNLLRSNGSLARTFTAYAPTFRQGVRVASGDLDGDGVMEILTSAGPGGGPHVRIFKPDGSPRGGFFAYAKNFRGGVNVAAGDLDGNGRAEIVTGSGPGGGPQVRIFDERGRVRGGFFAYAKNFRGGVKVAVADLNHDGRAEIVTAPGAGLGAGNEVKIFDQQGTLLNRFATFPKSFTGGINLAAGDLDGDGFWELLVAPQSKAVPEVRIYTASGSWQRAFLVYPDAFLGGVNLAAGDLDRDGRAELLVAPGPGGGPHVKVLDGFGQLKNQFFPFDTSFRGGVSIGVIKL